MCLVFTRMPGESYRRRLSSCPCCCLCDVFLATMNPFVCSFSTSTMGLVLFSKIVRPDGTQCGYCLLFSVTHRPQCPHRPCCWGTPRVHLPPDWLGRSRALWRHSSTPPAMYISCWTLWPQSRVSSNACPLKRFNHFQISYSSRLGNSWTFEVYSEMIWLNKHTIQRCFKDKAAHIGKRKIIHKINMHSGAH